MQRRIFDAILAENIEGLEDFGIPNDSDPYEDWNEDEKKIMIGILVKPGVMQITFMSGKGFEEAFKACGW